MILITSDNILKKKIKYKKKLKYSNNFSFVPIVYDNDPLIIQTPELYTEYGINDKFIKKNIDLSLINIENDNNIKIFLNKLELIYNIIKKKYKNYNCINFIKTINNNLSIRLKINTNIIIYNQYKQKIENVKLNNTYGNYLIHLNGIWIINNDIYYNWSLLQCRIIMPLMLTDYKFNDTIIKKKGIIPPPPPLPPKSQKSNKIKINYKKKDNNINNINNKNNNNKYEVPSLDDIKKALSNLKSI